MANRPLAFFIFSLIIELVKSQTPCPSQGRPLVYCPDIQTSPSYTVYVIDGSTDLPLDQIESEFNYTRYSILPSLDYNKPWNDVSFVLYGSGPQDPMASGWTNSMPACCYQLDNLQAHFEKYGSIFETLLDVLYAVNFEYGNWNPNVVLFAGSKAPLDIANAATYARDNMRSTKFTVIALNGALIDETNFPGTVYHVNDLNNPPPDLTYCLLSRSCGYQPNCTINEASNTGPTAGYPPPTVSTSPNPPSSLQCQCDTMSAWLDIVFVIDASASTGESGLDEMWSMAGTMLSLFNVHKTGYTASNYTSRVGIITYGNSANILYPLGSLDNDMIENLFDLPFNNDPMANLEAGLQAAIGQFNSPNHRNNARAVIIVMAAAFNPDGSNAPNKTAITFKQDGGILMVFNYVPAHGVESPVLESLASPGYFFSTTLKSHITDLALGLCDANCFCRNNQKPYGLASARLYPSKGCYAGISADTNYARANNNCKTHYYNGTVAADEDSNKTTFLKTLFPSDTFYIGLTYDNVDRQWEWPDGTVPGSYQPWVGGQTPDGSSQQCVYLDSNSKWQSTDCRNAYYYVCEIMPCDSVHYCG